MNIIDIVNAFEHNKLIVIVALFAAGYIDALPIAGFFVHGTWLLAIAILLLRDGNASILLIMICAFMGAYLGDQSGFAIGTLANSSIFKPKIINATKKIRGVSRKLKHTGATGRFARYCILKLIFRFIKMKNKAEKQINSKGVWGIIAGRFITPLRSVTPMVCAILKMSYKKFLLASFVSCMLWTIVWSMVLLAIMNGLISIRLRT